MKIIILSDANSIHTLRWVESLTNNNFDLLVFSFFKPNKESRRKYEKIGIKIVTPNLKSKITDLRRPNMSKIKYIRSIFPLLKIIRNFKPDLIHAHYASSYGLIALLTRFKPFILSVWGSDIYDFPYKNFINKFLLKLVLQSATIVCSTSRAMKKIIENEYSRFDVKIVPFGIDTDFFKPAEKTHNTFTVGTIKSIEEHNGIESIIDSADEIINKYKKNIDFLIVGEGSLEEAMKQKAINMNLKNNVTFTGFVTHSLVKKYYDRLSVFIAVSKRESFGVSILEAAGCEIPSITSNIGGLTEVNKNQQTGFVIKPGDPKELTKAILKLYEDEKLRKQLGSRARERVVEKFNWNDNVQSMIGIYNSFK